MKPKDKLILSVLGLPRVEYNSLKIVLPKRFQYPIKIDNHIQEDTDIFVISLDHVAGKEALKTIQDQFDEVPIIGMTAFDEPPETAVAAIIKRPVKPEELIQAIQNIQKERKEEEQRIMRARDSAIKQAQREEEAKAAEEAAKAAEQQAAEEAERQEILARDRALRQRSSAKTLNLPRFEPRKKLIGLFMLARQQLLEIEPEEAICVDYIGRFIFLPNHQVLTDTKKSRLQALSMPFISPDIYELRVIRLQQARDLLAGRGKVHLWQQEALLWQVADYCAQGAIPYEIDLDKPLNLKQWPDCSQLVNPLPIIALSSLLRRGLSLNDIHQRYELPTQLISRYITATYALSILDIENRHPDQYIYEQPEELIQQLSQKIINRLQIEE